MGFCSLSRLSFDSIRFNVDDGLVYFYKDNNVGLFPRHQTTQYDFIKQKTQSFYEISKLGKIGWLDIQTNREYF